MPAGETTRFPAATRPAEMPPSAAVALPSATASPFLTSTPTATPVPPVSPQPSQPDDVPLEGITTFAELPGNRANGGPAPDFSARLMGGGEFVLSEHRGAYWLILPTSMGCGECMYSLSMVTKAQPPANGALHVLVLDIYEPDDPQYWSAYLSLFKGLKAHWGVVNRASEFMAHYHISGLGAFLVIDPEGRLVYQVGSPPRLEHIQRLFALAAGQQGGGR